MAMSKTAKYHLPIETEDELNDISDAIAVRMDYLADCEPSEEIENTVSSLRVILERLDGLR